MKTANIYDPGATENDYLFMYYFVTDRRLTDA
jgi:hypothetical protein